MLRPAPNSGDIWGFSMLRVSRGERAFTLVEVLVACGLVALLALMASSFFSNINLTQRASQSRVNAAEELSRMADIVSDALIYRVNSSKNLTGLASDLRVHPFFVAERCAMGLCQAARFPIYRSDKVTPTVARITNACVPDGRAARFKFNAVTGSCNLKCPRGHVPTVQIFAKRTLRFPAVNVTQALVTSDMVGASVCIDWRTTGGVRDDVVTVKLAGGFLNERGEITAAHRSVSVPLVPLTGTMITIIR